MYTEPSLLPSGCGQLLHLSSSSSRVWIEGFFGDFRTDCVADLRDNVPDAQEDLLGLNEKGPDTWWKRTI